jgi:hypothetical protein
VIQDAGTAANPGLTGIGILSSNQQSFSIANGPVNGAYSSLSIGVTSSAATIELQSFGGAPDLPLNFVINGTTYPYPGTGGPFVPQGTIAPTYIDYLSPASGAVQRTLQSRLNDTVDLLDFGADPTGVATSTAAIRAAIAYLVTIGGGTIYVPNGIYNLTTPLITSGGQNAIVPLPLVVTNVGQNITIRIVGQSNVTAYSAPIPTGGVIFYSKTTATTTNNIVPSVFGYGSPPLASGASNTFTAITMEFHDLAVRVEANSGLVPIDLYAVANCILDNVSIVVDAVQSGLSAPTAQTAGLRLPSTGNFGVVEASKLYVFGFYYGVQHSEHANISALIEYCVYGVYIPDAYSHLAKWRITTQNCSYSVRVSAPYVTTPFVCTNSVIGDLDVERDSSFTFEYDFQFDSGCQFNAIINYNNTNLPTNNLTQTGSGNAYMVLNNIAAPRTSQALVAYGPSTTSNLLPSASETIAIPSGLTGNITLTVQTPATYTNGGVIGQIVRIYGNSAHNVTISTAATMYFQNNSNQTTWTLGSGAGSPQFLEMVWTGTQWFCMLVGGFNIFSTQVANAVTPGNFSGNRIITFYDASGGGPYYVAADTATW